MQSIVKHLRSHISDPTPPHPEDEVADSGVIHWPIASRSFMTCYDISKVRWHAARSNPNMSQQRKYAKVLKCVCAFGLGLCKPFSQGFRDCNFKNIGTSSWNIPCVGLLGISDMRSFHVGCDVYLGVFQCSLYIIHMIYHKYASGSKTVPTKLPFFGLHHVHRCVSTRGSCPSSLPRYIPHTCSHLESVRVQSATQCTECRYILHTCSHLESIRVQSATEWTASVHTLHMPKPNVTRVQSATEWTASVHTLHMPKPNVTRVQSATEWTASVHTLHMPKPNVTRVQSAREWTASGTYFTHAQT